MNEQKHAEAIFRDFEKLYRLVGLYQGREDQLQKQVAYIDNNLERHLAQGFGKEASVQYDLLMTSVFYEGEEVFAPARPECTLAYALFCEGVKSIIFRGALNAKEMLQWINSVRSVIHSADGKQDLASMLWRHRSPNIKVSLYNTLIGGDGEADDQLASLELPDDQEDFEEFYKKEVYQQEFDKNSSATTHLRSKTKTWRERDPAWDLPAGNLLSKDTSSIPSLDLKRVEKMRSELGDASYSDKAKRILRFTSEEIDQLKNELASYDENQVDYNLLVQLFSLFEDSRDLSNEDRDFQEELLFLLVDGITDRFHVGLILLLIEKWTNWAKEEAFADLTERLKEKLQQTFQTTKNLKTLAESFSDRHRLENAKRLIKVIPEKSLPLIFDDMLQRNDMVGQKAFLQSLLERHYPLEKKVFEWGPEKIAGAIPHLAQLEWEQRQYFLIRCVKSRFQEASEVAVTYLPTIELPTQEAIHLFKSFSRTQRKATLKAYLNLEQSRQWKSFFQKALEQKLWDDEDRDLMELWVRLLLKHIGAEAMAYFDSYVKERVFFFWPKHPKKREVILKAALKSRDFHIQGKIRDWVSRERRLWFQSASLKELLATKGRG